MAGVLRSSMHGGAAAAWVPCPECLQHPLAPAELTSGSCAGQTPAGSTRPSSKSGKSASPPSTRVCACGLWVWARRVAPPGSQPASQLCSCSRQLSMESRAAAGGCVARSPSDALEELAGREVAKAPARRLVTLHHRLCPALARVLLGAQPHLENAGPALGGEQCAGEHGRMCRAEACVPMCAKVALGRRAGRQAARGACSNARKPAPRCADLVERPAHSPEAVPAALPAVVDASPAHALPVLFCGKLGQVKEEGHAGAGGWGGLVRD